MGGEWSGGGGSGGGLVFVNPLGEYKKTVPNVMFYYFFLATKDKKNDETFFANVYGFICRFDHARHG